MRILASLSLAFVSVLLSACVGMPTGGGYAPQQGPQGSAPGMSVCPIDGMDPIRGLTASECENLKRRVAAASAAARPQEKRSPTGCGVETAGQIIKELPQKSGTTCEARKKAFIAQYMARCHGKQGSLEKDIECGRRIDI